MNGLMIVCSIIVLSVAIAVYLLGYHTIAVLIVVLGAGYALLDALAKTINQQ